MKNVIDLAGKIQEEVIFLQFYIKMYLLVI